MATAPLATRYTGIFSLKPGVVPSSGSWIQSASSPSQFFVDAHSSGVTAVVGFGGGEYPVAGRAPASMKSMTSRGGVIRAIVGVHELVVVGPVVATGPVLVHAAMKAATRRTMRIPLVIPSRDPFGSVSSTARKLSRIRWPQEGSPAPQRGSGHWLGRKDSN